MTKNDITNKAISSTIWTSIERVGALGIQFVVTMVLARILSPSDFGLVGMLSLFTAVGSLLLDSGFSHALIQKEKVDNKDYSTVFTINLAIGIVLYAVLFFSAPLIAWFLEKDELVLLSRVIFLMFLINSFCVVPLAKLTRELRFKKIAFIGILSAIFSGVVGLLFAFLGMGIWALVAQQLGLYVSRLVLYWVLVKWHPTSLFSRESFHVLWRYSSNLLYASLISTIFDNIYVFLVGKFFSLKTTGYFNQAWQLGTTLPSLLTGVVSKAMFPIFCKVGNETHSIKAIVRQTLRVNLFISIPCMFALIMMASNVIVVLYSDKWLPSVPMLQLVCIYGAFLPLRVVNTDAVKSLGDSKLYMRLETLQRLLVVLSIVATVWQGIIPLLWGRTIACCAAILIDMYMCGKRTGYGVLLQLSDQWKTLVSTIIMCGVMLLIGFLPISPLGLLLLQITIGVFAFVLAGCLIRHELCLKVLSYIKKQR